MQQCSFCALQRENKPESLIATPLPDRPWQVVATDLFKPKGIDYLIIIDYFPRYVEVAALQKTANSNEFIRARKSTFAPEQVRSDNGPQFECVELSYFAKEWGFKHTTSRPRFPLLLLAECVIGKEHRRAEKRHQMELPNYPWRSCFCLRYGSCFIKV